MTEFKINTLILLLEPPFQMIIKQQANYAKVPVVSEFTHSFHSLLPVNSMSGLM